MNVLNQKHVQVWRRQAAAFIWALLQPSLKFDADCVKPAGESRAVEFACAKRSNT